MLDFNVFIDLSDRSYRFTGKHGQLEHIKKDPDAFRFLADFSEAVMPEELCDELKAWCSEKNILAVLKEKPVVIRDFTVPDNGESFRVVFMEAGADSEGNLKHILCGFQSLPGTGEKTQSILRAEDPDKAQEHAIRKFMELVLSTAGRRASVDELVAYIGGYFDADRAYIFEQEEAGRFMKNTHEWCAKGISSKMENLQKVPLSIMDPWVEELRNKGSFFIERNDECAQSEPFVTKVLKPRNIMCMMVAPMMHLRDIIGFFALDNPKKHKDQQLFLSVVASVLNHEILQDSERKVEEIYDKVLKKAVEDASAANDAKTSFLFNMSHDIRTPINAIMGFRDLLERHQEEPKKRADYLKKIAEASNVLLSIINNVLEMARIEKGTLKIEENVIDIDRFADTVSTIFRDMMVQKQLRFTTNVNVKNRFVYSDETKIREILYNLLSNAYKYTRPGGSVNMTIEELPSEKPGELYYRTSVSDTGIGMSPEFLTHIFDEFSRENNTTEAKVEGTGLGMSIVKRLVDILGGTIEIRSEKGVGSTFTVTLPHRIAEAPNHAKKESFVQKDAAKRFTGKRLLLAEDNDLNAEIVMELLEEEGFSVDRADDGIICVEMMKNAPAGKYCVILMDIQMPNMNGYEATRRIRAMEDPEKNAIPIIAVTANAFEEDRKESLKAGMNAHLAKPINMAELLKTLTTII